MSSNNQIVILKNKEQMFEIHENLCVNNDFIASEETRLNTRKTLEEACKFAQKYQNEELVEYGIYINSSCWKKEKIKKQKKKNIIQKEEIVDIDYYYNPNVECTCEAIFADTHKSYCKRRIRPK